MIINKVTELFPQAGSSLTQADVQAHLDLHNQDGWYIVGVDNLIGWYRFFWAKEMS